MELEKAGMATELQTPATVTQDSICKMVVTLKSDAAFFDAAAKTGPVRYRTLCRAIADGVLDTCKEVGL